KLKLWVDPSGSLASDAKQGCPDIDAELRAHPPATTQRASADAGPRAEIMKRSGHGDRTHYIRHLDSISHWLCASTNTQETRCDGWRCRCLFARKTLILDQSPRRSVGGSPVAWTRSHRSEEHT